MEATVLCPRQKQAFATRKAALSDGAVAHLCPVCGFWHKGPLYLRCGSRKVPRATRTEAQREADRLNANPDGWGKNYPYKCSECGNWHVGRPHKGKMVN